MTPTLDALADVIGELPQIASECRWERREREHLRRVALRLRWAGSEPPLVRESALADAVARLGRVAAECPPEPGEVVVFSPPEAPWCVEDRVAIETAAAGHLATWGFPEAASTLRAASERWSETPCRTAPERDPWYPFSPASCWCGDARTWPTDVAFGTRPSDGYGTPYEVRAWDDRAEVCSLFSEITSCTICETVRWTGPLRARSRARRSPLARTGSVVEVLGDRSWIVTGLLERVAACGPGSAEWLGSWMPGLLGEDEGGSSCIVDALDGVGPQEWSAVYVRQAPDTSDAW